MDDTYRSELEANGVPDLEGPLPEKAITGDGQEGLVPPRNTLQGADEWGVTASEQARPETVADRAKRELPDRPPTARDDVGRIVDPADTDVDVVDDEKDAVASIAGDASALSAEEQAMHVEAEPDA